MTPINGTHNPNDVVSNNKVIHSSHFWLIFNFIFISFFKNGVQNEMKMNWKMNIFEKLNPSLAFAKMFIFTFTFLITFSAFSNSILTCTLYPGPTMTTINNIALFSTTTTTRRPSHWQKRDVALAPQAPLLWPLPDLQELEWPQMARFGCNVSPNNVWALGMLVFFCCFLLFIS